MHLLVELFLPHQYGIEVVGFIRALLGADKGNAKNIPDDFFQRLTVLLIHGQQEKGQHGNHHAHGGGTGANGIFEQKEKRNAKQRTARKADKLPFR